MSFIQVVLDSLQEYVTTMSDCLDNRQPVTQLQVHAIVQRASAFSSQVTVVVNDIGIENIDRQTIMMTRELKAGTDMLIDCTFVKHIMHEFFFYFIQQLYLKPTQPAKLFWWRTRRSRNSCA